MSYKKDIDDLRESPAVEIVAHLAQQGFHLLVVEPHVKQLPATLASYKQIQFSHDIQQVIAQADALLILVDHIQFAFLKNLDLSHKIVVDACGILAS